MNSSKGDIHFKSTFSRRRTDDILPNSTWLRRFTRLSSAKSIQLEIRQTENMGAGVFTKSSLPRNTTIMHYEGFQFSGTRTQIEDMCARVDALFPGEASFYTFQFGKKVVFPEIQGLDANGVPVKADCLPMSARLNHTKEELANVKAKWIWGKLYLVAKRDIASGEELRLNYWSCHPGDMAKSTILLKDQWDSEAIATTACERARKKTGRKTSRIIKKTAKKQDGKVSTYNINVFLS
ncbi:hypothetical protein QR680_006961 [Steinernema hermaphroditum]|uniref:SET domain-containing protein n=1 Tax=Steinernema hermaphroditum TaxID=289476 RepID=A0AA39HYQ3_9BILA|nr:hypothetical protein QR680_006961 [Steinernema hermaphroditum]